MLCMCILFYALQLLGGVHSDSLGELLNENSRCFSYERTSVCPGSFSPEYTFYTNSSTQFILSILVEDTHMLLNSAAYSEYQDCSNVILNYICDIVFPPCTSGVRNSAALCPNCANTSSTCMTVYRNISSKLTATTGGLEAYPLSRNLSQKLNGCCLMNATACGPTADPATVTTENPGVPMLAVYLTVVGALVLVCAVAVLEATFCYCCCMPTKMKMVDLENGEFHVMNAVDFVYRRGTKAEYRMSRASMIKQAFFKHFTLLESSSQHLSKEDAHSAVPEPYKSLLAHKKHLVIHHKRVSLEKCLNEGALSDLHLGSLLELGGGGATFPLTVAVRAIDTTHNEGVCVQVVAEVCKMADLMHPHILNPFGVAVAVEKPLYVVFPFLENRDLLSCLKTSDSNPKINHLPRINLIFQIALGMDFLAYRGIVHRNLSAKNCLLDSSLTVKIGGFGAPEALTSGCVYSLPADQESRWKWTALELLNYMERVDMTCFREHTDVWAFGITAWEVYSLLDPYEGSYLTDVLPQLLKGLRLPKPDNCSKAFYDIMVACWHGDPGKRPLFKDLSLLVHRQVRNTMQEEPSISSDSGLSDDTYTYAMTVDSKSATCSSLSEEFLLAASQPIRNNPCTPKQQQQQQKSRSNTEPLLLHVASGDRKGNCKPKVLPKPAGGGKGKGKPVPPPKPAQSSRAYENLSMLVLPKCQSIPTNLDAIYYNERDDACTPPFLPTDHEEEADDEYIICTRGEKSVSVTNCKETASTWTRGYPPSVDDLACDCVYENPAYQNVMQ